MPSIVRVLDDAHSPIRRITAVSPEALPNQLTSEFSSGTLGFLHSSAATSDGKFIKVDQYIKIFRMPPNKSAVFVSAPYISAVDSLKVPLNADAVASFALRISNERNQWKTVSGSWGRTVGAPINPGKPSLFIRPFNSEVQRADFWR